MFLLEVRDSSETSLPDINSKPTSMSTFPSRHPLENPDHWQDPIRSLKAEDGYTYGYWTDIRGLQDVNILTAVVYTQDSF